MVYFLLAVFLMARVEPVLPYLKVVPKITHNLLTNLKAFCTGTQKVKLLADVAIDDTNDDNNKEAEKEGEKEVGKSVKEECKMLLYNYSLALADSQGTIRTQFQLYLSGKVRNHINKVFRPPLV